MTRRPALTFKVEPVSEFHLTDSIVAVPCAPMRIGPLSKAAGVAPGSVADSAIVKVVALPWFTSDSPLRAALKDAMTPAPLTAVVLICAVRAPLPWPAMSVMLTGLLAGLVARPAPPEGARARVSEVPRVAGGLTWATN